MDFEDLFIMKWIAYVHPVGEELHMYLGKNEFNLQSIAHMLSQGLRRIDYPVMYLSNLLDRYSIVTTNNRLQYTVSFSLALNTDSSPSNVLIWPN